MRKIVTALAAFAVVAAFSLPAISAQGTKFVGKYQDWALYEHDTPQIKTCFVMAGPKVSEPAGARRDSIYFYVSAWPREGVKSEVSVKVGYPIKKGSEVLITVGNDVFKLFARDERAFVADAAEEIKLLEALRKGSTMVVQGTSERGTVTKDTYSLAGTVQALQALASSCD